jgi:tetratricopeptide (TPR) repeat protein
LLVGRLAALPLLGLVAGLLFLVNVTHFQAVHHISALDYPLALCCGLAALLCWMRREESPFSARWTAAFYLFLVLGLIAHLSILMAWLVALYMEWRQERPVRELARRAALGSALVGSMALALLLLTSEETSTWHSLEEYTHRSPSTLLWGIGRVLLWFVSRLFSTAHWVPLAMYQQQDWELWLGGGLLLVVLLVLLGRGPFLATFSSLWVLLGLMPFLLLTEATIADLPAGPSRYLYLASAGSSLVLARGLVRVEQWRRYVGSLLMVGILASSYFSLRRVEALSFYTSARSYMAAGEVEQAVLLWRRAIDRSPQTIPLEETYFRLGSAMPYLGEDPRPVLRQGLALFPESLWLNTILAAIEAETAEQEARESARQRLEEMRQRAESRGQAFLFNRNVASLYHNLANNYMVRGQADQAIQAYALALQFESGRENSTGGLSKAHTLLGIQLEKHQQPAQAMAAYRQALEIDGQNAVARVNLGWLLYLEGHWQEAIDQYQVALSLGPSSHALFNLGLAYLVQGRVQAARQTYARAVAEFGAREAEIIGAVSDLKELIDKDLCAAEAQDILETYWPDI